MSAADLFVGLRASLCRFIINLDKAQAFQQAPATWHTVQQAYAVQV